MQNVCDTLYTADYVVTQNDGRDIIQQGAVAVCEDHILCVGHTDILEILYPNARRVDLGNAAIMPGLINAHTHVPMSLLRGYSDDKALMDWLTLDIFPQEAKLSPELVELGAQFSLAEMIRSGTTAFTTCTCGSAASSKRRMPWACAPCWEKASRSSSPRSPAKTKRLILT